MITEPRDHHVCQQTRARDAARDRPARRRGLEDALATGACQLRSHGADHLEACRHVLQVLGHVRADAAKPATAGGAATVLASGIPVSAGGVGADLLLLARQVSWQPAIQRAGVGGYLGAGRGRHVVEHRWLQQAGLGVVESFARNAVLGMQSARQLQRELVHHQLQGRHLGHALAQVLLEQLRVVGQVVDRVGTGHGATLCPKRRPMSSGTR